MSINASARKYRVWVCRKGEPSDQWFEVTNYCSGDSSGYLSMTSEPMGTDGLIRASGKLTLVVPPDDLRFDPWENPARWQIGNYVLVQAADQAGTLRSPPINRLSIVADPTPPYPGNWVLELELGCALVLYDGVKPMQASVNGSRLDAINALASRIGDELSGGIPGKALANYQPDTSTSLVQQAGELALGGYSALYQGRDGGLNVKRIDLKPQQRLFKHWVGLDDAGDFEPLQSQLRPPSDVEVVATESAVEEPDDGNDSAGKSGMYGEDDSEKYRGSLTTAEPLSKESIAEGGGTEEIVAVIRTETWKWSGAEYEATVEESRCRGLIVPESLYEFLIQQGRNIFYPGPYGRFPALSTVETKQYENSKEGRLLSIKTSSTRCRGEVLAEWYKKNLLPNSSIPNFLEPFEAERTQTTYEYKAFDGKSRSGKDSKGQVRKIVTRRWAPRGEVAAAANDWIGGGIAGPFLRADPTELIEAEVTIQSWRKRSKDCWEHTTQLYKAGQVKSGSIQAFCQLHKVKGSGTKTSRNGEIRPPAAERRPAILGKRNRPPALLIPVRGKVNFDDTSERSSVVQVQNVEDEKSAQRIAELLGSLDHCRHRGFRITTALRDEWFSWKPLSRVDLAYRGFTYWGLTDAVTFLFAKNQAIVVADCMRLGRAPDADPYPFAALPPLMPTDPDPESPQEPLVTDLYPEMSNKQPLIPVVQAIYPVIASGLAAANFALLPYVAGEQPRGSFVASGRAGIFVTEAFVTFGRAQGNFALLPLFIPRAMGKGVFALAEAEPGLAADWELIGSPWEDETTGNNDLSENGTISTVYDSSDGRYVPEFGWYPSIVDDGYGGYTDAGSYSGWLECSGNNLSIKSATERWTFKVTFDLFLTTYDRLSDYYTGEAAPYSNWNGYFMALESQWFLALDSSGATQRIYWGSWGEGGSAGADIPTGQWATVSLEYDAPTAQYGIRINGVLTLGTSGSGGVGNSPGTFFVGPAYEQIENFRIKNLKFYKLESISY